MNLLELPSPQLGDVWPSTDLSALVEWITGQRGTFTTLTGELDPLGCSVVAMSTKGRRRESLRASIARSGEKLQAAARLVEARYAWRGYIGSARTVPAAYEDRCVITLIAETGEATVGTVTVGMDGPLGLRAEEIYPREVSAVRAQGGRVCELGRLALAREADTRTVLSMLFSLAYGVGKALQDVTDVFIEVNPRHVGFYRRVFGFVIDAGERFCERVQAPAVLLRTSIDELESRLRGYCQGLAERSTASGMAAAQAALA